jgi:hypothetical protein
MDDNEYPGTQIPYNSKIRLVTAADLYLAYLPATTPDSARVVTLTSDKSLAEIWIVTDTLSSNGTSQGKGPVLAMNPTKSVSEKSKRVKFYADSGKGFLTFSDIKMIMCKGSSIPEMIVETEFQELVCRHVDDKNGNNMPITVSLPFIITGTKNSSNTINQCSTVEPYRLAYGNSNGNSGATIIWKMQIYELGKDDGMSTFGIVAIIVLVVLGVIILFTLFF